MTINFNFIANFNVILTDGAGNYFQMNASTGVVTVKTEIRQDLLQLKAVSFKFTVSSSSNSGRILAILLLSVKSSCKFIFLKRKRKKNKSSFPMCI